VLPSRIGLLMDVTLRVIEPHFEAIMLSIRHDHSREGQLLNDERC
jgi:hypothetical protein